MKVCKRCGTQHDATSRLCSNCGRTLYPSKMSNAKRTIVRTPVLTGSRRFVAHHAVIASIATDVAAACAKSYCVTKVQGSTIKSDFTLVIFPAEIRLDSYSRFPFANYGMGNLNISDLEDFRNYFRGVFSEKFRTALSQQPGSRYEFTVEDQYLANMFDAKWAVKVTVWSSQSGLTAW